MQKFTLKIHNPMSENPKIIPQILYQIYPQKFLTLCQNSPEFPIFLKIIIDHTHKSHPFDQD